jgi:TolA-binding protein
MRLFAIILSAAIPASADVITTRSVIHTGEVIRVDVDGVEIRVAIGEITIPKADILKLDVAKPAAVDLATVALKAGKYSDAVTGFKSVADQYAGLATPWAEEALIKLGEANLGAKNYPEAKQAFDNFKRLYPKSPLAGMLDVKYARVLLNQGDAAKATEDLQVYLKPILEKPFLSNEQEVAVTEALVLLGDCQLAAGKNAEALDSYLTVVTLFDLDVDRAAEAKYKAGKIFEQLGNWKRAKDSFSELLKESPSFAQVDAAKKRLDDLTQAHPE